MQIVCTRGRWQLTQCSKQEEVIILSGERRITAQKSRETTRINNCWRKNTLHGENQPSENTMLQRVIFQANEDVCGGRVGQRAGYKRTFSEVSHTLELNLNECGGTLGGTKE